MQVFFRLSRADNSVVGGPIGPKFELVQYIIHVLITCKLKKEPRKNGDIDFRRSRAANFAVGLQILIKFELIQALMHVLINCKYHKDWIINSREKVETTFSHRKPMGFFHTLKGS